MTSGSTYAVISCDIDTIDRHLQGYGLEYSPPCDLVYRTALPRVLDLFAELGLKGVLFAIGRDAKAERRVLREAIAAGHEIASHSLTHPQPFRTLGDAALHEEVVASRARLTEETGTEVSGFRAPAWDVDARVLGMVRDAGYRYDASIFPSPALVLSRVAAYRRSTGKRSILSMDLIGHAFTPVRPYRLRNHAGGLAEFPIAVTPWLRIPMYQTVAYFAPKSLFRLALRGMLRTEMPVCYEFHAVDLLDLDDERIDPAMSRHPGTRIPWRRKRQDLRETLRMIAGARRVITYRQAMDQGLV